MHVDVVHDRTIYDIAGMKLVLIHIFFRGTAHRVLVDDEWQWPTRYCDGARRRPSLHVGMIQRRLHTRVGSSGAIHSIPLRQLSNRTINT
jgi:hypothetical protein